MRKIVALLSAGVIFTACSKEEVSTVSQNNGVELSTNADGKLEIVNETFTIGKGKANAQTYILRAIASAPVVNGVPTNCTSIEVNPSTSRIYATWHTAGSAHGGAISGYSYDLTKTDETILQFTGELRFPTVDMHEMDFNVNKDRIYYVGQRDKNDGTYSDDAYNNKGGWHGGAVAGYVDLDASYDLSTTFNETALFGFAGNAIAQTINNTFDVITGEGVGNVIRLNADLTREGDSVQFFDGEYLIRDGANTFAFQGETGTTNRSKLFKYDKTQIDRNDELELTTIATTTDLDKNAMTSYNGDILIANGNGITLVNAANTTESSIISNIGGVSLGVAADASNDLVYLANADGGLYALDATNINSPSVIGNWRGPNPLPSLEAKDVYTATSGSDRFVFVVDATGALYIIQKL